MTTITMKFLLAIFLLYAASVYADNDFEKTDLNCFIRHLKGIHRIDEHFAEYDVSMDGVDCQTSLVKVRRARFKLLGKELRSGTDQILFDCMMDNFREQKLVNDLMVEAVYDASTTVSAEEKKKAKVANDAHTDEILDGVINKCIMGH